MALTWVLAEQSNPLALGKGGLLSTVPGRAEFSTLLKGEISDSWVGLLFLPVLCWCQTHHLACVPYTWMVAWSMSALNLALVLPLQSAIMVVLHLCWLCIRLESALGEFWMQLGEAFRQALFIWVGLICLFVLMLCVYPLAVVACSPLSFTVTSHLSCDHLVWLRYQGQVEKEHLFCAQAFCDELLLSPYFCNWQCKRLDRGCVTACRVLCAFLLPFLLLTTCAEMETNTSKYQHIFAPRDSCVPTKKCHAM